jgi:hypothetical protein
MRCMTDAKRNGILRCQVCNGWRFVFPPLVFFALATTSWLILFCRNGLCSRRSLWTFHVQYGVRYTSFPSRTTDHLPPRTAAATTRFKRYGLKVIFLGQKLRQNWSSVQWRGVRNRRIQGQVRPDQLGGGRLHNWWHPGLSRWPSGCGIWVRWLCSIFGCH